MKIPCRTTFIVSLATLALGAFGPHAEQKIAPGGEWRDKTGNLMQAHGGGILKYGDVWYRYGEEKRDGCFPSGGATGWTPNAARLYISKNILGPYSSLGNPCRGPESKNRFVSQSTFVLPMDPEQGPFIFMGDRWIRKDSRKFPVCMASVYTQPFRQPDHRVEGSVGSLFFRLTQSRRQL